MAAALALTVVGLNGSFYRFLARKRGTAFAAGAVPLHLVYFLCCGASVVIALALWGLGPGRPAASPAVAGPRALGRQRRRRREEARWVGR